MTKGGGGVVQDLVGRDMNTADVVHIILKMADVVHIILKMAAYGASGVAFWF